MGGSDQGNDATPDQGGNDATPDSGGGGLTIYDLQDDSRANHPAPETEVTVQGRVTAIDRRQFSDDPNTVGSFWIQEPAGGPYSGIMVFNFNAENVDISTLDIGQTVEVGGTYVEFEGLSEIRVSSLSVVDATAQPLTPETVSPAEVATGGAQAEAFEGVLVQVGPVTVTADDLGFGKFEVADSLEIDDELTNFGLFPPVGTEYDRIAGVLTWSFGAVQLLPRDAGDLEGEIEVVGLQIQDIQDTSSPDHPSEDALVTVEGIVTGIDLVTGSNPNNADNFWVQDAAGGEYSGIMVFTFGGTNYDVSNLALGYTVRVTGAYVEFFDMSEINVSTVEILSTEPVTVAPLVVAAADLATSGADREKYEGVFVRVENVEVTTASENDPGFGQFEVDNVLLVDDSMYWFDLPAEATTYDHIDGIMFWGFDAATLNPRMESDLVVSE